MSKAVDQVSSTATREALWEVIRAFSRAFTARELQRETRCSIGQTRDYLLSLTNAGIVVVVGNSKGRGTIPGTRLYRLERDLGIEAPRLRRDGTKVVQGRGREQIWETMRSLCRFSAHDIHVLASTDDHQVAAREAKTYCSALALAGYLRKDGDFFTLIRRTGPKPPMIQRTKQVYDPNLGQVVGREGEAGNEQ